MTCKHGKRRSRCRMCTQDRLEEVHGIPEDSIESTDSDAETEE